MSQIVWSDDLSVDVAEIDQQHKKLLSMVNRMQQAMGRGNGLGLVRQIVDEMVEYVQQHFATEEHYFRVFSYPHASDHLNEHIEFVRKVVDFRQGLSQDKVGLAVEVHGFLSDWLQTHIRGSDQQYAEFFHSKGLH